MIKWAVNYKYNITERSCVSFYNFFANIEANKDSWIFRQKKTADGMKLSTTVNVR